MKILIADDDASFRNFLKEILGKWGYEVIAAGNGYEAWSALMKKDAPRLAILDWLMPEIDGLEICRKVRKEIHGPYTYLIILTSQQREEDLIKGMEAGADDYLTKPLKTHELKVRLDAGKRVIELQNELVTARDTLAAHTAELEAANRNLEAFSFTVANDLMKSLLQIGENARSLQDLYCRDRDEQCKSYTHQIYVKTRYLGQLIAVMQDYFRPARLELDRQQIDLSAMARKPLQRLRTAKPDRNVTVKIPEGITAYGDENLLQVVLNNLFDNAWKHTAGRKEAVIEFGVKEKEGKPVYFVRDNGTGFEMAQADKLFIPFSRLPDAEKIAGQGLGLATAERIIIRHGGKIWAEGEPDKGATFYFTL